MKPYYVILSSGEYSDYSPRYFVGERELAQEQYTKGAEKIGDEILAWYEGLPKVMHKHESWCNPNCSTSYGVENGETVHPEMFEDMFIERMEQHLKDYGFERLPGSIPEVNIYYDIPSSKVKKNSWR